MYEVRFNAQQVAGYKTSWLLWPDIGDEAQGEIDFPEGNLQQTIDAFMHHVGPDFKSQDAYVTSSTYAGWHTAATIWTAKSVIFILDGKVIGDSTDSRVRHSEYSDALGAANRNADRPRPAARRRDCECEDRLGVSLVPGEIEMNPWDQPCMLCSLLTSIIR